MEKTPKRISAMLILLFLVACNDVTKVSKEKDGSTEENHATGSEVVLDTFKKVKFLNRAEELIYIRKYIEYRLPKIIIETEPEKMEHALEVLVGNGKNVTLEEAVKYTLMYEEDYDRLWYFVTEDDLSFVVVKKKLSSYETLYPVRQQKIEEENIVLPTKENDEVELPPVVEEKYNPDEEKIHGDFNGDGKPEYAYRVLTKRGKGNPVEDGTEDEYEIQFSDKNIFPVKVGCCWFKLIPEGDLDNDGTDEFSIAQNPMNGCIGSFKTFTNRNNKCVEMFSQFVFYNCNELSIKELESLVTNENGVVYYREIDPNGGKTLKKRAVFKN